MVKPTFHIVYSTIGWVPNAKWKEHMTKWSKEKREKFIREQSSMAECCDMTLKYTRELMVTEARQQGFEVVRWPIHNREAWLAVGEAATNDSMVPGSVAVLHHAWGSDKYEKECVPAWDFYPVLNALKEKHDMIYPHPKLDQLHSEKRYSSSLMAPTRFVHLVRRSGGWQVRGRGATDVAIVVGEELKKLEAKCAAKELPFTDVMVKEGLSWGGEAVTRHAPSKVQDFVMKKLLPGLPKECQHLTVLIQAKVDIVSELRWCMVNGDLRSREWKSLNTPGRGEYACDADYQDQHEARELVEQFCNKFGKFTVQELENNIGVLCKRVYAEMTADAGGEPPLYARVDFLLDKQGRLWLGERESYGADINGNDETSKMDPTYKELVTKMLAKTRAHLKQNRHARIIAKTKAKLSNNAKDLKNRRKANPSVKLVKRTIVKTCSPRKTSSPRKTMSPRKCEGR